MHFPIEWESLGMYPDELYLWQVSGYEPGHENGSEHDRNGAFHWWLKRNPTRGQVENLVRLAAYDPDPMLGEDVRQYIRKAKNFDAELDALAETLFSSSRRTAT